MDKTLLKQVFKELLDSYYEAKSELIEVNSLDVHLDQKALKDDIKDFELRFKKALYGQKSSFVDDYLNEIMVLQQQVDKTSEDSLERAFLLSKQNVFIGRLAAELAKEYKMIYARRKQVGAEARIAAKKDKEAFSELAIAELREEEADAYGMMHRWRNAFESTKEQIHAIKIKHKILDQSWSDQGQGA